MQCQACGRDAELAPDRRVGFRDACEGCDADLHTCRNCAHHDPAAYNECRETSAERVLDKERANRCEWFQPGAGQGAGDRAADARAALDALFDE